MNKYQLKQSQPISVQVYEKVCIHCGKETIYEHKVYNSIPRPRPNTTPPIYGGSKVSCLLGNHLYYFKDEVEKI